MQTEQDAFTSILQSSGKTLTETSGNTDGQPAKPTQAPTIPPAPQPSRSFMPTRAEIEGDAPMPAPGNSIMPTIEEIEGPGIHSVADLPPLVELPKTDEEEASDRWDRDAAVITQNVLNCLDQPIASVSQTCAAKELNVPLPDVQRNWAALKEYRDSEAAKGSFDATDFIRHFPYEAKLIAETPEMTPVVVNKAGIVDVIRNGPAFVGGAVKIAVDLGADQLYRNLAHGTPFTVKDLEKAVKDHGDFIRARDALFAKETKEVPVGAEEDLGFVGNARRDLRAGFLDNEDADLGERMISAIQRGDRAEQAYLLYLHKQNRREREKLTQQNAGALGGIRRDVVQSVPGTLQVVKESGITAGIGAAVGAAAAAYATKGAGTAVGAKIGAEIGAGLGVFHGSYSQQSGSEIWDMLELKSDNGKQLAPWQAVAAARKSAIYGATLETAGDILDIATLGGAHGLRTALGATKKGAEILAKYESKTLQKAAGKTAAGIIARGAASEGVTEGAQSIAQIYVQQDEKEALDGEAQRLDFDAAMEDVFRSSLVGAISGAMFSGGTAAGAKTIDAAGKIVARRRAEQNALVDAQKLMAIASQFSKEEAGTRRQLAETLLKDATSANGDPIRSVDVDVSELVAFFQKDGKNWADEVSRVSGQNVAALIRQALDRGGPLNVGLDTFAVDFSAYQDASGRTLASALAGSTSVNDQMTAADVEAEHARDVQVGQAIDAAVSGKVTEEQEAELKAYAARHAGDTDFLANAQQLVKEGHERLTKEAKEAAPHLGAKEIEAAIDSQLALVMRHAVETGDIGPLETLAKQTKIEGATVQRLESLIVQQNQQEGQISVRQEEVQSEPAEVQAEAQTEQEEATLTPEAQAEVDEAVKATEELEKQAENAALSEVASSDITQEAGNGTLNQKPPASDAQVQESAREVKKRQTRKAKKTRTEMDASNDTTMLPVAEAQERAVAAADQVIEQTKENSKENSKPKKATEAEATKKKPSRSTRRRVGKETIDEQAKRDSLGLKKTPEGAEKVATGKKRGRKKVADTENAAPEKKTPRTRAAKKAQESAPQTATQKKGESKTNERAKTDAEEREAYLQEISQYTDEEYEKAENQIKQIIAETDSFVNALNYRAENEIQETVGKYPEASKYISSIKEARKKLDLFVSPDLEQIEQNAKSIQSIINKLDEDSEDAAALEDLLHDGEAVVGAFEGAMEKARPIGYSIDTVLFQRTSSGAKGAVEFTGADMERAYKILLSPDATMDTIVHETSHIILDAMYRTAQRKDATPEFKEQYGLLQAWLGLNPGERPTVEQQERFASQAVLYLSEGETELGEESNAVFEFTKEALRAYKAEADVRGDKLSPEADAFFSKFFGADDAFREIAHQAVSEELGATIAITPPAALDSLLERAEAAADGVLRKDEIARLRAELAALTKEEKDSAASIFKKHLSEIKQDPGYIIRRALLDGEYEGVSLDGARLNRDEFKTELGIDKLPPNSSGLTAKDGMTWQEFSGVFPMAAQFASAREFYNAVSSAPNSAVAEARRRGKAEFAASVQEQFAARHVELEEAVKKNSVTASVVHDAFETLRKLDRSSANLELIEAAVGRRIADAKFSALNFKSWLAQAKYARRKVMAALTPSASGKGGTDVPKAAYWQEKHLYAMLMQEGIRSEEYRFRRDERWMRNAGKKEALAELDRGGAEFRDVMASFLEAVGAKRPEEGAQVADRKTLSDLKEYINAHAQEGGEPWGWDDATLNKILNDKARLKDMKVSDRRYLSEFLHWVASFGQSKQVDIAGVSLPVSEWSQRAAADLKGDVKTVPLTNTGDGVLDWLKNWSARSQESKLIFSWLGETGEKIWGAMKDCEYEKTLLGRDIGKDMERIFDPDRPAMKRMMEAVELDPKFQLPDGIDGGITRQNLVAMLLNMGNEGNRQRLLDGFGGAEKGWTAEAVMDFLNANLTDDEIKMAEEIWNLFDSKLYPRVAETFRKTENRPMGKVPALQLNTKAGTIKGGYYPIRYDARITQTGTKQELSAAKEVKDWREACQDGFTKKRVLKNSEPLSLDLAFLPSAVMQQLHYATHEYVTANVSRLLNDKNYTAALKAHLGKYRAGLPEKVLKVFANGPERTSLGPIFDRLGSAMTNAVLAFTMPMVTGDWARPVMAIGIGKTRAADSIRALLNIRASMERASELSKAYNIISGNFRQRFVSSAYAELNAAPINATAKRRIKRLEELGFAHAEFNTKIIAAVMWNARFEEEMRRLTEAGVPEAEAQTQARDIADGVVFDMTPNTVDWMKAPIQNNPLYRLVAVFASEGLKMYSILMHTDPLKILDEAKEGEWWKAVKRATAISTVLFTYPLLSALLMGRGPEDDEDSWDWAARTVLQQISGFEPVLAANAYSLAEAKLRGKRVNSARTPAVSMLERMETGLFDALDLEGTKDPAERYLGALNAFGPLAGVPVNQTNKMVKAALGIGKTDEIKDPVDFIEAWMYGRSQKRGWNPISQGEKR